MDLLNNILDLIFSSTTQGGDYAYFIFLLNPYMDDFHKNEPKAVRELAAWLKNDDFKNSNLNLPLYYTLVTKLDLLKKEFFNYFKSNLIQITQDHKEQTVHEVYTKISNYFVQVMRLRMIVEPEYQLTINKHGRTKIVYLVMKSFWIDEEGKKKRMFYKAFAREDAYADGRNSKKALQDGLEIIQSVMYEKYKEIYGE